MINKQCCMRRRVSELASRHNVSLACWEDGLYNGDGGIMNRSRLTTDTGTDVYSNAWNNVWQIGNARRAYELANAGYKVSHFFSCI